MRGRWRLWSELVEKLLCMLFPARCLWCGKPVEPKACFCDSCLRRVPKSPMDRNYALSGFGGKHLRVLSPMAYASGYRYSLFQFKFRGRRALCKPLGRLMAQCVSGDMVFDAVTYVPLSKKGRRKRGYDQSRLLAREVAFSLDLPLVQTLEKAVNTKTQHELPGKERVKNIRNAYRALPEAQGKRLLLIDDIVTTGATLKECATVLYKAGARDITCLCAAEAEGRKK